MVKFPKLFAYLLFGTLSFYLAQASIEFAMSKRMVSCLLLLSAKITAMPTIAAVYIAKDWTQHFVHSRQVLY